ncbi:hypothetical protein [Hymenobacter sp. BT190]|uniref:hypothetical protein n=1 Tax=Hymenobacter sp. BT190 TaxID=2763505 RepID=UPI00165152AF|nr:hypothetical protein [Hymenobacter sp. BT190]MBC6698080.1 hypothetical protein [Hymenobacter sp. BT190]
MVIQLKEALAQMEARDERRRPVPFSVEFCTCDENREEGGEIIRLDNVVLARNTAPAAKRAPRSAEPTATRQANEWAQGTRNFYLLDNQQIRKAAIRLIIGFNNMDVVY